MPFVSFLLPLLFWHGFAEASNTPKWIFLSAVLPFLFRVRWSRGHTVLTIWLAWCALTLLWGPVYEGVMRMWQFSILFAVFCIGSSLDERYYRQCIYGFAAGVFVSLPVMGLQYFGWEGLKQAVPPAGLWMNKNYLAEVCLFAAVGLACLRSWLALPFAAGMAIPASMGVFLSTGVLMARRWWKLSPLLIVLGMAGYYHLQGSEFARISLWMNSLSAVTVEGHGAGSFWSVYPQVHDAALPSSEQIYREGYRPRTAHNDAITMLVEIGIIGVVPLAGFFTFVLGRPRSSREHEAAHYIVLAFLAVGLVAFPAYLPAHGYIAFLSAGFLCGGGCWHGDAGVLRGGGVRPHLSY